MRMVKKVEKKILRLIEHALKPIFEANNFFNSKCLIFEMLEIVQNIKI